MKKVIKKTTEDYLTGNQFKSFEGNFEKHMTNIAKSFSRIDERLASHDKAFGLILKQMQEFREEVREHRQTMSSLIHTDIKQEKNIEDLRIRVERLEAHIK